MTGPDIVGHGFAGAAGRHAEGTAGGLNEGDAGGDIPKADGFLIIDIEEAIGDVGEGEGGGADHADLFEGGDGIEEGFEARAGSIHPGGEAGGEGSLIEAGGPIRPDLLSIAAEGAGDDAAVGIAGIKVEDSAEDGGFSAEEADADGAGGITAEVVVGTVEGIDDPVGLVAAAEGFIATQFLAEDGVIGGLGEGGADEVLGFAVGAEFNIGAIEELNLAEVGGVGGEDAAGGAGGFLGDMKEVMEFHGGKETDWGGRLRVRIMEEGGEGMEVIGLGGGFIGSVAEDTGKAEGDTGFMAGGRANIFKGDFEDLLGLDRTDGAAAAYGMAFNPLVEGA